MPKRKHKDEKEEKWLRKLRKYEEKLYKNRRRDFHSEDDLESPGDSVSPPCSPQRTLASVVRPGPEREVQRHAHPAAPVSTSSAVVEPLVPNATDQPNDNADASTTGPETLVSQQSDANKVPASDPELLLALGVFDGESEEWGPEISNDLAKRWEPILRDGLKKEARDDALKKCLFPKNCTIIKPPILNPEISAMLNESARNRDSRVLKKQTQIACAITSLGNTMSNILTKSIEMPEILRNLSEVAKIIADSHFLETETRRSLIIPMLDKGFIESFKNRKRDNFLFGDKLGDFIKSSCGIQKTGKLIQQSTPSRNLNSKLPPPRTQANFRGSRTRQQNRSGGIKPPPTTYRYRPTTYQSMTHAVQKTTSQRPNQTATPKQKQ